MHPSRHMPLILWSCIVFRPHYERGLPVSHTRHPTLTKPAMRYKDEFKALLSRAVAISNGIAGRDVLSSGEVLTQFTAAAERQASRLPVFLYRIMSLQSQERLGDTLSTILAQKRSVRA